MGRLESLIAGGVCRAVAKPPSYLMRLIQQIDTALAGADAKLADLQRWAYGVAEYEIVRWGGGRSSGGSEECAHPAGLAEAWRALSEQCQEET